MTPLICFCSFQHVLELPAQAAKACSPALSTHSFHLLPHPSAGVFHCPTLSSHTVALTLPLPIVSSSLSRACSPGCTRLPFPRAPTAVPSFLLYPSPQIPSVSLRSASYQFPSLPTPIPSPASSSQKKHLSFCQILLVGLAAPPLSPLPSCLLLFPGARKLNARCPSFCP